MERSPLTPTVEQMLVRGRYERIPTDTAHLAGELVAPQNLAKVLNDFDNGATPLRDVGSMVEAQRTAILASYQRGDVDELAANYPGLFSLPVINLHERVVLGEQDQPIGHNFFVNAAGFVGAEFPWAKQLDEYMRTRVGVSIQDIVNSDDYAGKDGLLADMTNNPGDEFKAILGVYLAGRSLEGEKYLTQQYGEVLEQNKHNAYETIQRLAHTTGLRPDMLARAAEQLQRTTFGSFDHLEGLVTSGNSGAAGDYHIGSLRVEVHYNGDVAAHTLRDRLEVRGILSHELHHAASAQTKEKYRNGLQINGEGLEVNEGMTEYLAQLSNGAPAFERTADGAMGIRDDVAYRTPTFAMYALHQQFKVGKNNHFAVLFNAYHGDVRDEVQLEQALDAFYTYDIVLSGGRVG